MSEALLNAGRQTLMLELQEASRLPERLGDDFVRAANIILHCEGKVVVSGIGKSGHIGKKIAATLASTGTPAFFVHPAEALHGDLGMIESRDVMLFISYSGGAKELDLIIPRLEDKSIALLAMTGKPTSPLGLAAKAVLDISVEREACPMHLAPTSSTVNTLMMGDALAMAVMQARGFNEEDFARSHPAGALGARLLNKVHHLMRRDDAIPQVALTASVMDAMLELSRTGLGNGISASDWRTGSITHLQGLTNVQRVWCLNIVALSKVTEIVASNPGDIEKCVAFFHGVCTAAITAFRNVPILTVVDDSSVFHLYRLLSYWLHWLDLRLLSSLNLWLLYRLNLRLLRCRRRPHFRRRRNQHTRIGICRRIAINGADRCRWI